MHKPAKSHPWRNSPSSKVLTWAREKSALRDRDFGNTPNTKGVKRKGDETLK